MVSVMIALTVPAMGGHHGGRTYIKVWRGPSHGHGGKHGHGHASFGYHFKHPAPKGGKHHG